VQTRPKLAILGLVILGGPVRWSGNRPYPMGPVSDTVWLRQKT